jgi:hypothetical protein
MKSPLHVIAEATFVGTLLVAFYLFTSGISKSMKCSGQICLLIDIAIAGFLFHIVFEYTGINKWYSIDYMNRMR